MWAAGMSELIKKGFPRPISGRVMQSGDLGEAGGVDNLAIRGEDGEI